MAAARVPAAARRRPGRVDPPAVRAAASGGCPARVRRLALFFCVFFWPSRLDLLTRRSYTAYYECCLLCVLQPSAQDAGSTALAAVGAADTYAILACVNGSSKSCALQLGQVHGRCFWLVSYAASRREIIQSALRKNHRRSLHEEQRRHGGADYCARVRRRRGPLRRAPRRARGGGGGGALSTSLSIISPSPSSSLFPIISIKAYASSTLPVRLLLVHPRVRRVEAVLGRAEQRPRRAGRRVVLDRERLF